jgi:hypothetical protein
MAKPEKIFHFSEFQERRFDLVQRRVWKESVEMVVARWLRNVLRMM